MKHNRHFFLTVGILVFTCIFILKIEKTQSRAASMGSSIKDLPIYVGEWVGKDLPVSSDVYEILQTKNVLMREYKDPEGAAVLLTIVYSVNNIDTIHPPEMCYVGGGAKLTDKHRIQMVLGENEVLTANKLVLKTPKGIITSWHWFTAGEKNVSNYYLQQLYLALNILRGKEAKGALVRVSINDNSEFLEEKAKSFIKVIRPVLQKVI